MNCYVWLSRYGRGKECEVRGDVASFYLALIIHTVAFYSGLSAASVYTLAELYSAQPI
jgi:hypothetical protein